MKGSQVMEICWIRGYESEYLFVVREVCIIYVNWCEWMELCDRDRQMDGFICWILFSMEVMVLPITERYPRHTQVHALDLLSQNLNTVYRNVIRKRNENALKTLMLPDSVAWLCHVEMNPLGNCRNCSASWRYVAALEDRLAADIHVNTNLDYVLLFYRCQR